MSRHRFLRLAPFALLLAAALSACTIYIRPGGPIHVDVPLNPIIVAFAPTRGEGATYHIGDRVEFRIRTTETGYVTLTAMDPDGRVYVLSRNIRVRGGHTVILPTPDMRVSYTAAPPGGFHRIRASFTSARTDPAHVTYMGRFGNDSWTSAIEIDIRSYPVRDIAETNLVIR